MSRQEQETFCFFIALCVNFVDQLWQFTLPVVVPYGKTLGADIHVIAVFATARGLGGMTSNIWMPWVADGPKGKGRTRRRLAVLLSLAGCSVGYFLQGFASRFAPGTQAPCVMIIGRFIVGFFSGMNAVLTAYITDLCRGDFALLKERNKIFQVTNLSLGIALAPIAGALAQFGLEVPFYVATCTGVVSFIVAYVFFKESFEQERKNSDFPTPTGSSSTRPTNAKASHEGNPYCDLVTWLVALANLSMNCVISGGMLLLPILISDPGFGLRQLTEKQTEERVAVASGVLQLPGSATIIFASMFLYSPLTNRFGDVAVVTVGGFISFIVLSCTGLVQQDLLVIAGLRAIFGISFGSFLPALTPMFSQYVKNVYPTQQSTAQGGPQFVGQAALLFAQNMFAAVVHVAGITTAYFLVGFCVLVFAMSFALAFVISHRVQKKQLSDVQRNLLPGLNPGKDVDTFVEEACGRLRKILEANRAQLWNGTIQSVYFHWVDDHPNPRAYETQTGGREYLEDVYSLLLKHAPQDEIAKFEQSFPDVTCPASLEWGGKANPVQRVCEQNEW
eukprot:TRINITY_DN19220_c0_g2_i1.p1 TRINITY_DN19220_c0_g2~~TRINITY_DN19220_c0_g2_i1.p1  ORF type:complete len:561 (+),score=35.57 TRINITY_DN19220_c0_g2_i1:73-1755(+)